jgi:hypothetical protein
MAGLAQIPRSRGSVCGILLILLGAWGGLGVFVGPYFHFGFTPDKAWGYTTGRLYLSAVPGAAAVLGGLLVLATRSRAAGAFGGLLAAVGGGWLIVGYATVADVIKNTSISPGLPMNSGGLPALAGTVRAYAEQVGFFTGIGGLIIFFGALAIGRFSMLAAKDAASADYGDYQGGADQFPQADTDQAAQEQYQTSPSPFPVSPSPFPPAQYPSGPSTGQFPAGQQYPPPTEQFPPSSS